MIPACFVIVQICVIMSRMDCECLYKYLSIGNDKENGCDIFYSLLTIFLNLRILNPKSCKTVPKRGESVDL